MFGYVSLYKDKLNKQQIAFYQTFMCGLCMSTKRIYGNFMRNFVNYDINFLNILFHSVVEKSVDINMARCISNPFVKRSIIANDELTDKLSTANVLLTYYNVLDDCIDGKSIKKKMLLRSIRKHYLVAKNISSSLDNIISTNYLNLRKLEQANCAILDQVCDCFALLSRQVADNITGGNNSYLSNLCYNVGKWIYLIDALEDLEKDFSRGNYNPLIASFGKFTTQRQFIDDNKTDLNYIFYTTLNKIAECFNDLNPAHYTCLLKDILYYSLRNQTAKLLGGQETTDISLCDNAECNLRSNKEE
ncbi:MAG: DUF5685 family protein [Clostridia bacterium]